MNENAQKQKLDYGRGGRSRRLADGEKKLADPPVKIPGAPNSSPPTKRQPSKP